MPESLTFDVIDPRMEATLQKAKKRVILDFGTVDDAEQFFILLGESARLKTSLTIHLRPRVE